MFVVGVGINYYLFFLICQNTHKGGRVIVIVTINDLLKQGIIREYIPPRAVTLKELRNTQEGGKSYKAGTERKRSVIRNYSH